MLNQDHIRRTVLADKIVQLISENEDIPFGELMMASFRRRNFNNPTKEPLQLTASLEDYINAMDVTMAELRNQPNTDELQVKAN